MPWYTVRPPTPQTTAELLTALRPRADAIHVTVRGELPAGLPAARGHRGGRGPVGRLLARLEPDGGAGAPRQRTTVLPGDDAAWSALLRHLAGATLEIEVVADHRLVARVAAEGTPVAELTADEHAHLAARLGPAALEPLAAPPAWYRMGRG